MSRFLRHCPSRSCRARPAAVPIALMLGVMLGLAACASPSPAFLSAPMRSETVAGWSYDVYIRPERAQAIRRSAVARGLDKDLGRTRGMAAIERATGCEIKPGSLRGDPVVMTADLNCPGAGDG